MHILSVQPVTGLRARGDKIALLTNYRLSYLLGTWYVRLAMGGEGRERTVTTRWTAQHTTAATDQGMHAITDRLDSTDRRTDGQTSGKHHF